MAKIYEAQGALAQSTSCVQDSRREADAQHNDEKNIFLAEKIQHMQARIAAQPTGNIGQGFATYGRERECIPHGSPSQHR